MRRLSFLVLAALVVALTGALPAHAQDILGVSLRPTDALPDAARGSVDIESENGGYIIGVDLSAAEESLVLGDFDDAAAWVVWAVDMDGVRHNIGALADDLTLTEAETDFLVAKVFVTAEASADVASPDGEPLFRLTLRDVEEVDTPAADEATTAAEDAEGDEDEKSEPAELPTTGLELRDLLVLAIVALALLLAGFRLRPADQRA